MYKQTEDYYKTQNLGFGNTSIYDVGCYLVSLCNGLNNFGHDFTPRTLNDFLKEKKLWTGEFKNYIDVDRLSSALPEIFSSYKKIEPWDDLKQLSWYLARDYVVLGKVSAKGIGGSGTHFVLITGIEDINVIIFDPWTGEHQAVAKRYGKLGNILSLRIFGIINQPEGKTTMSDKQVTLDSKTFEELVTKSGKLDKINQGDYVEKSELEKAQQEIGKLNEQIKKDQQSRINSEAQYKANSERYREIIAETERLCANGHDDIAIKAVEDVGTALSTYLRRKQIEENLIIAKESKAQAKSIALSEGTKEFVRMVMISAIPNVIVALEASPEVGLATTGISIALAFVKALDKALHKYKTNNTNGKETTGIVPF